MELNAKQKKCAAALILLTAISRNADLKEVAEIFGKLALNYSNVRNHALLTDLEPELGELFETYLDNIKIIYTEQTVSDRNSRDFQLLSDINEAVERATRQYNDTEKMVDLTNFKRLIQSTLNYTRN
jgi:hypothetical protein